MGQVLFGRSARVVLGQLEITGLRIAFQVQRTAKREPNSAETRIWNLNGDHRAQLQQQRVVTVRLEAGYDPPQLSRETEEALASINLARGGGLPVLFTGDLRVASSERQGPDWVTTITSDDGGRKHRGSRASLSFRPKLRWRQAFRELVAATGLGEGNALRVIDAQVGEAQIESGMVVAGNAVDELDRLLKGFDMELSIQDDELQVLPRSKAFDSSAVLLTPATGLVGSPEPGSDGVVKFRSLLQPDLFPGRKVKFESERVTGFYRVETIAYVGDTHDTDWYAEGEAAEL